MTEPAWNRQALAVLQRQENGLNKAAGKTTFCPLPRSQRVKESVMKWTKPKIKEVCVALEINDYFPAEYEV